MGEPEETYVIYEPSTDDPQKAIRDIVRQLNEQLLRIAEKLADKEDA